MAFNYQHRFLNLINQNIETSKLSEPLSFPAKVKEYDGVFCKVESLLKDNVLEIIEDVAVLQSPYLHLPIKEGDVGLCLNCDYFFYEIIKDKELSQNIRSCNTSSLFFIPLVTEEKKVKDIESTILFNENKEAKLTLKDKNLIYENENTKLSLEDKNLTFDNKELTLKIKDDQIEIDNKSIKIEISGDVLTLKGSIKFDMSAIKVEGMAGSLGKAFEQVFTAMDLLSTGLTGPSSSPSAYNLGKSAIQQVIKQIVE